MPSINQYDNNVELSCNKCQLIYVEDFYDIICKCPQYDQIRKAYLIVAVSFLFNDWGSLSFYNQLGVVNYNNNTI